MTFLLFTDGRLLPFHNCMILWFNFALAYLITLWIGKFAKKYGNKMLMVFQNRCPCKHIKSMLHLFRIRKNVYGILTNMWRLLTLYICTIHVIYVLFTLIQVSCPSFQLWLGIDILKQIYNSISIVSKQLQWLWKSFICDWICHRMSVTRWCYYIWRMLHHSSVNTLMPRQNSRHLPDEFSKCISFNENVWISN